MKLEHLSSNLVLIIQELVKNQDLCKYLYYNTNNPLSQANLSLPMNSLIQTKIFPYPFDKFTSTVDESKIHVYYPRGEFTQAQIIENTEVVFDVIVAKNLWLVNDGASSIRPLEIIRLIVNDFSNKSLSTVGKLKFKRYVHWSINEKFDGLKLTAEMMTIG